MYRHCLVLHRLLERCVFTPKDTHQSKPKQTWKPSGKVVLATDRSRSVFGVGPLRSELPNIREEEQPWTALSSSLPKVRCSTAAKILPVPWRAAVTPPMWRPATAGLRCCSRTRGNCLSCAWFRSPCSACCRSRWCLGSFSWDATWWSSRRVWSTFWWKTGDLPKTWKRWWSDWARAHV